MPPTFLVLLLFLLLWSTSSLVPVHQVIIIGAGISGVAASRVLTRYGIPHLMLEARNRTGGRILAGVFEGVTVDFGASFVHKPNKTNPIVDLMHELNWTAVSGNYFDEVNYYEGMGVIDDKYREMSNIFEEMMKAQIFFRAKMAKQDISVKEAAMGFFRNIMDKEKPIFQDLVYWSLEGYGNVEGAEIKDLSARQLQYDESSYDMFPTGGFPKLFQGLLAQCKHDLRLNEKVIEIDYGQDPVRITTTKGVHFGKKLISSIPLGVLQSGQIKFVPPLPQPYSTSLFHLGSGCENKLYVSFQKSFWGKEGKWLNFISRGQKKSKYSVAYALPAEGKHILIFFLAGDDNKYVGRLSQDGLKKDILRFLCPFLEDDPVIKSIYLTKWHLDPLSLGSYTYYRVGGSRPAIEALRTPLRNKVWFVGEHAHPDMKSLTQGAYLTGVDAAQEIANEERPKMKMKFFE